MKRADAVRRLSDARIAIRYAEGEWEDGRTASAFETLCGAADHLANLVGYLLHDSIPSQPTDDGR